MRRIVSTEGIATIAAIAIVSLLYVGSLYMPDIPRDTFIQAVGWMVKLGAFCLLVWLVKSLILAVFFD